MQIRWQLANVRKKEDESIGDYFNKVKCLTDTLVSISKPLLDEEVISYVLVGLDIEYDSLVTSITTRPDELSLNELYAHMVNHEMCLHYNNVAFQALGGSANLASIDNKGGRSNYHGRGCGRIYGGPPCTGGQVEARK